MSLETALHHWRDRMVCRHQHGPAGRWTRKDEEPKYPPDRTCDVEHLRLELDVDLPARTIEAVCTQTLYAAYGPFESLTLNAVDLSIRSVRDGQGRDLPYTYLDRKLAVHFPEPVTDRIQVVIAYQVVEPVDGLFFMGPDEHEPGVSWQLWSQGEDECARYWIPCHDAPNERMTCELSVTAPEEYSVIANGALLRLDARDGRRTWHYRESVAIPSYLISVVVGVFSKLEDHWQDVPVEYWVEPGREEEGRRSFGRTPDMMEFFSKQLDCQYPYEKYAQVAVRHFHFGGMENASATTQTDTTLHDERAAIDFTSDGLVAHELAHMWFGDLITCKSWTHAWLNEGFATYLEALWKEWDKGSEEFEYEMVSNADTYLSERYRRAIASPRYAYPFELFDAHLYPKAAWVLHMLRRQLGEELFWKSVRLYVKRHAGGVVETIDLIRSFEDASGRNLDRFFDQWIFSQGHPQLEGDLVWDADESRVTLTVKQTQKREDGTPLFRIPMLLQARLEDGTLSSSRFEMTRAEQSFHLPLAKKPVWAAVDPEGAVLRETKIKRPTEWAEAALLGQTRDERVFARVDLVRQLANEAGNKAVEILTGVLREDPFWGVAAEAASALGQIRSPAALEGLLAAIGHEHAKVRRAVMTALGHWRDNQRAAQAVLELARRGDASYFVQSQALASLGQCGGLPLAPELRGQLQESLERRDWHDHIAQGAIQGLAAARDESALSELRAVAADRSRYWNTRLAAIRAMAEIGAARPNLAPWAAEAIVPFLEDPRILVHTRTAAALVTLGHASGLEALRRRGEAAARPELREACLSAAEELSTRLQKGEEMDKLRTEVEKLREETRELKETVERLKTSVEPTGTLKGAIQGPTKGAIKGAIQGPTKGATKGAIKGTKAPVRTKPTAAGARGRPQPRKRLEAAKSAVRPKRRGPSRHRPKRNR